MRLRYHVLGTALVVAGLVGFAAPGWLGPLAWPSAQHAGHLAAGIAAFAAARRGIGAMRSCGKIFGVAFVALAILGFATDSTLAAWLHLLTAAVFLYQALLAPPTL